MGFFVLEDSNMIIHRILNNNVIITLDKDEKECVVCGKGIAFKKKIGDEVDSKEVNKVLSSYY